MVAIDEGHEDELKSLTTNPHAELPVDTDTAWKRETGATSLVRKLQPGNGFEALRQLILTLRPPAQNTDWGYSVPSLLSFYCAKALIATAATKKL